VLVATVKRAARDAVADAMEEAGFIEHMDYVGRAIDEMRDSINEALECNEDTLKGAVERLIEWSQFAA
jgi:hypothetical protein